MPRRPPKAEPEAVAAWIEALAEPARGRILAPRAGGPAAVRRAAADKPPIEACAQADLRKGAHGPGRSAGSG
jgi:hypothetical protein